MKKILFLLLITVCGYGQTYQNPTFGTVKTKTAPTVTTTPHLGTVETDGTISKIAPENIPVNISPQPINYTIADNKIGSHLKGIDNKFGSLVQTTAGVFNRIWFTGDISVVNAINYFTSNAQNKGTVATASPTPLSNGDDQKQYFTQDLIGGAFPSITKFPAGTYAGQLTVRVSPNSAQQRYTVEIYKTNNLGVPIASGISGAPVGDLGVTVVAILDSGNINLADNAITGIPVTGILASELTINATERIRYHVSAAKIGTASSNITMEVFYGSSYNSYYDVPVTFDTNSVKNVSSVAGNTATEALNNLNTAVIGKLDKLDATPPFTETIPYKSYTSFGDSYTFGAYVNYPSNKYPNIIGSFLNLAPYNFGVSSNQAADEQVKIYSQSISDSGNELNTTIIGSNDITGYGGDLDKQDNYKNIYSASLAWLGIPNKQIGQSTNITYTGTWSNSTRFGGALSKQTTTNGDKASFVINGTKAYISYCMIDGNGGTFTVTVDGVPTGVTYNCFGKNGTAISTLLGHTYGSGLIRITGLTDANHTIELTVTSATSASNVVQFDWGGTNKGINTVGKPTTIIGKIVRRFSATYIDDYNALIESIYNDFAVTDGMNFYLVETDYVLDIPADLASDNAHPNDTGMRKIAQPFIDKILELYPQSTPANVFSSTDKIDFNAKESIFKNKLVLKPVDAKFEGANVSGQLADSGLWTTTGWTGSLSTGFVHTAGNLSPLTSTKKVVPGSLYAVSFGFEGSSAGSVDVYFGGVKIGSALNIGIYNLSCKAVTDDGLKFVPTTDFASRINDIEYIEVYGGSEAQLSFEATDGTVNNEIRTQKALNNFSIGVDAGAKYYRGSNNFNAGYQANFNGVNSKFGIHIGLQAGFNSQGSGGIHLGEGSGFNDLGDNNITIGRYITGDLFNLQSITGDNNVIIGRSCLINNLALSNQLSIMNSIYGTNLTGTSTAVSNQGKIGLFVKEPLAPFHIVSGNSAGETMGGVTVNRGVWLDVTSSRSGFTAVSTNGSLASYGGNSYFGAIVPFDTFSTDRTFKPFRLQTGLATLTDRFYITGYGEGYFQNAVSIGSTSLSQKLNVAGGGVFSDVRASAGNGLILDFDGTKSRFLSYFYSTTTFKPIEFDALSYDFKTSSGSKMTLTSSVLTVNVPIVSPVLSGDPTTPTPVNPTSVANKAYVDGLVRPYKVYVALLSQSGTSAPVATVLENTLGGTITWSRNAVGEYFADSSVAFSTNVGVLLSNGDIRSDSQGRIGAYRSGSNRVIFRSFVDGSASDTIYVTATIEIRVYP